MNLAVIRSRVILETSTEILREMMIYPPFVDDTMTNEQRKAFMFGLRSVGKVLYYQGKENLMQDVYYEVGKDRAHIRIIDFAWDGIGQWQA